MDKHKAAFIAGHVARGVTLELALNYYYTLEAVAGGRRRHKTTTGYRQKRNRVQRRRKAKGYK